MAWEKEVAYLAEKNAHLVKYVDNELLFRRELVRGWPREPDALMLSSLEYLNQYATAANGTTPTARQYVDDPQVLIKGGTRVFPGRWRIVHNTKTTFENEAQIQEQSGILQTLRFGLARTLDWEEVRIVSNKQSPGNSTSVTSDGGIADTASDNPEDFMLVEFVNIDPDYVRQIISTLPNTIDFTTSTGYRTQVYPYASGSWHKIAATALESELDDGSARIQILLARPQFTIESYRQYITFFTGQYRQNRVFYLWNVPKVLAQTIITTFKATGRTAIASYGSKENLVDITLTDWYYSNDGGLYTNLGVSLINCSTVDTTIDIMGVYDPTDPVYDIWLNDLAQDPGYTITKDVRLDQETGRYDLSVKIRHVLPRNYGWRTNETSETAYARAYQQFGIPADAALLDITNLDEQGLVYDQSVSIQDDCTRNAITRARISRELELYTAWADTAGINVEYLYQNERALRNFNFTNVASPANASVSTSVNQDGTYNQQVRATPSRWTYRSIPLDDLYYMEKAHEMVALRDGSYDYETVLVQVWVKKFSTHDAAADFADNGDTLIDREHGNKAYRFGASVEYAGRNQWIGRQVQLKWSPTAWNPIDGPV